MSKRQAYEFPPAKSDEKVYWRSLEAKADPDAYQRAAEAEFPQGVVDAAGLFSRRSFVTLASAAAAASGLAGCIRRPVEKILPYSKAPEHVIPGVPLHYATVLRRREEAIGVVVESHEGRPTKIEGNPEHPGSEGSLDLMSQASVLDLYDADRSKAPSKRAGDKFADQSWDAVEKQLTEASAAWEANSGQGLRFLVRPSGSPSFKRLRSAVLQRFPKAKFYSYAPVNDDNVRTGARVALGESLAARPLFDKARVVLALDSDFLQSESGSLAASRAFARARRVRSTTDEMSRLYVVEPSLTVTGSNADHRLTLPAQDVAGYLLDLAHALNTQGSLALSNLPAAPKGGSSQAAPAPWVNAVAKDLIANRGKALIVVGARQPAYVHALAFALNHVLGALGNTLQLRHEVDMERGESLADIQALAAEIKSGAVEALLILGGNPALDAPADLDFPALLRDVKLTVHLSGYAGETSALCGWHIPRAHALEAWGDELGPSATWSLQQPLVSPLFGAWSDLELLARIAHSPELKGYDLVRATLRDRTKLSGDAFERAWRKGLHRGVVEVASEAQDHPAPTLQLDNVNQLVQKGISEDIAKHPALSATGLEVTFAPDLKLFDGEFASNPWLLELPDPITKVCWDNAALISPALAKELSLKNGQVVELSSNAQKIELPVVIMPGQAHYSVAVTLGWGRQKAGRHGSKVGFNTYPLRSTQSFAWATGVKLQPLARTHQLALTQEHSAMEGRPVAIDATLGEFRKQPNFPQHTAPTPSTPPLWRQFNYAGYKWGMSIDLSTCNGCNACVVACQAENNIPTVGKQRVIQGREMYWIRIDRYYAGDEQSPEVAFQPVACQHCENAPCENVCPVNATAHSPEGLNDMAYNRCIGTRYCMNNCPYKVRRFNYFNYQEDITETKKMQHNPNVTVRMRGVIEKCSYCVQRIQAAKITAKVQKRKVRDGDITPACAQTCPTESIVFGDLNDPKSRIAALAKAAQRYQLLAEIGTQPRTSYLGKIRNPNPELGA